MYYKILPGGFVFDRLSEIFKKGQECDAQATAFAKKYGFAEHRPLRHVAFGGIESFHKRDSDPRPKGFRFAYGSTMPNDLYPNLSKTGKRITHEMQGLPVVELAEIASVIGFKTQTIQENRMIFLPKIVKRRDYFLVSMSPEYVYTPAPGMIPITGIEFKELEHKKRTAQPA